MGYFLFLLVNATLFLRPAELFPELASVGIYEALIVSCFIVSFPGVVAQLSLRSLEARPITIGVFVIWIFSGLSHLMQMELAMAGASFYKFFKVVIYYLLLVALVNTPARLRWFLAVLGLCVTLLTMVAMLRYYEVITIRPPPTMEKKEKMDRNQFIRDDDGTAPSVEDKYFDDRTGEEVIVHRLRGTGIFNDPNDLCLALVFGVLLCLYGLCEPDLGMLRFLCIVPLGLFLFALRLTYSRGGLLGLMAGMMILFACRYGRRRTIYLGLLCLPIFVVLFGGRMTAISSSEGTAQTRLMTWRDGLVLFKEAPLFGIGMDRYAEFAVQVAHNSFLHMFTELGILGGMVFVGMFFFAFWALQEVRRHQVLDPPLKRLLPFLIAIVIAYAAGIFTLSRSYDVPTYTMLGLATAFLAIVPVYPRVQRARCDAPLLCRTAAVSFCFLVGIYGMVNALVR